MQLLQVSTDSQPLPLHPPQLLCHGIGPMQQSNITRLAVVGMDR